jgi:hypothetical protein
MLAADVTAQLETAVGAPHRRAGGGYVGQFRDAGAERLTGGQPLGGLSPEQVLSRLPAPDGRGGRVLQPPVRVGDREAVQIVGHRLALGGRISHRVLLSDSGRSG